MWCITSWSLMLISFANSKALVGSWKHLKGMRKIYTALLSRLTAIPPSQVAMTALFEFGIFAMKLDRSQEWLFTLNTQLQMLPSRLILDLLFLALWITHLIYGISRLARFFSDLMPTKTRCCLSSFLRMVEPLSVPVKIM